VVSAWTEVRPWSQMQAFSMEGELGEGGKFLDWSASGDSFVIKDKHHFEKNILVQHFRHCNFSSFVRQLNKYGFKKVSLELAESNEKRLNG
jgi:osomolarity two-component system response regulator SKN7